MNIKGVHALVTGSSSGIGAATAIALAEKGCNVAITWATDEAGGKKVAAACGALGVKARLYRLDVRDDGQCKSVVKEIVQEWGSLEILVNSAGTTRFSDLMDLDAVSAQDFLDIYNVNVVGVFQMTRAAGAFLKAQPVAHVVNIASTAAMNGRGSSIAYAASKGALITLTKSMARALAPEVRVNAICPGLVNNEWSKEKLGKKAHENHIRLATMRSNLKSIPTSKNVAESIVACITGMDMMTGASISIDGGAHLGAAALQMSKPL